MHPGVVSDTIAGIEQAGGSVMIDPATDLLLINAEISLSIVIVRCRAQLGGLRWKLRLDTSLRPDITVAVRMDADSHHKAWGSNTPSALQRRHVATIA